MQERKLMMRLPPGQRFVITYDREGASLYAIATPTSWDADNFATATNPKPAAPVQRPTRLRR